MIALPTSILCFEEYKAYLQTLDLTEIIGHSRDPYYCPIASMITHKTKTDNVVVGRDNITINNVPYITPEWIRYFIALIDKNYLTSPPRTAVTAECGLDALQKCEIRSLHMKN